MIAPNIDPNKLSIEEKIKLVQESDGLLSLFVILLLEKQMTKVLKVRLTFTEDLLGTKSFDEDLFRRFIATKNPEGAQEDELKAEESISNEEEAKRNSSGFHRNAKGQPILWDYQIKGFFKDACSMLNRTVPAEKKLKAFRKEIDGLVFVNPREIAVDVIGEISWCTRPLRVNTAQGERVALANSEAIPAGSSIEIEITVLKDDLMKNVKEWLKYGKLRGLGQWRNSGKGRFTYEEIKDEKKK